MESLSNENAIDIESLKKLGFDVFDESRRYWLNRTQQGKYFNRFHNESYIGIEWDEFSDPNLLNEHSDEALKEMIIEKYPKVQNAGYVLNQIKRFMFEMRPGDIVLIPSSNSDYIAIGEISSEFYIHEPDEFENFINSDVDDEQDPIIRKRRNVNWIKQVSKKELDPYLYKIIYSQSAIAKADIYAPFIDRMISPFYIKGDKAYYTLHVNKIANIPYRDTSELMNITSDIMTMIESHFDDIDYSNIVLKINVQSKGPLQFSASIKGVLILSLVGSFIFGANTHFSYDGKSVDFGVKTDGIPGIIRAVEDFVFNEDGTLKEGIGGINERYHKVAENLELDVPVFDIDLSDIDSENLDIITEVDEVSVEDVTEEEGIDKTQELTVTID